MWNLIKIWKKESIKVNKKMQSNRAGNIIKLQERFWLEVRNVLNKKKSHNKTTQSLVGLD